MSIEEYRIISHEAQQEFDRKRNYPYQYGSNMETVQERETKAILAMGEAIKALNQQLSDANRSLRIANDRIAQLESEVYGGPTK